MCLYKIYNLIALAVLLSLGNAARATVNDFGNLQYTPQGNPELTATFANDSLVVSMNFDSMRGSESNTYSSPGNNYKHEGRSGHSDRNWNHPKPIISPVPEPETYVMILTGLVLIGITARRRKENS